MDKIRILGGRALRGSIHISGAKNAALPLLTAALLTDQKLVLENVPNLSDVHSMLELLEYLGVEVDRSFPKITLQSKNVVSDEAPYELVRKMRASILVMGPLVARYGAAKISLPGGCAIGARPVDLHLSGLEKLGAEIHLDGGYVYARAPQGLRGADINMSMVSVTGTENLLMAATLAEGQTRILNAAQEPEIVDLANCLNAMGAKISGQGTSTLVIEGVKSLHGATHSVLPDRIETGTYAMLAAMTGGDLLLQKTSLELIPTVSSLLKDSGAILHEEADGFRIQSGDLMGRDVMTEPFPGFPTDLQAQFMALMTLSKGASMITETIFENRFMHVPELCRMGANITIHGKSALVRGGMGLKGAQVMATDLRASVSLVMAGLAAEGETVVSRVYHLDRGYENIENKLRPCGADIERISGD